MADVAGIKTYRTFGGKRFKFKDQAISEGIWRRKKRALRSEGYLVRTHIVQMQILVRTRTEQMQIHKKYQIYVRKP